jgi:uncharacterized protein YyaL (SSP411 family)
MAARGDTIAPTMASSNRLIHETSPYLLQHAHNPVDWYPWGDEAFARARAENKPILLSIGYSACHWCHVMERESFENPAIAQLMNELFVNIKVDREERPDVDDVYMRAVQLLIGRGGWPLTAFLTPDRKPFHGGTYFPPTDRHGLPGFPRVLAAVAQAYREKPDDIARSVGALLDGIQRADELGTSSTLDPTLPGRAADALLQHVDTSNGGLGTAPKFPHTQAFQLLLRHYVRTGRAALVDAVTLTCRGMAEGGMYDQIGGGFHRYSVDARWLVPHFEKMLYDNAQLPRLYLDAFQVTGEPFFRQVVEETLDYVLREMRHPAGGFYSATDADSEGEEGKFFVWTPEEVTAIVGPDDGELVCRYWDVTEEGNFEGHSIAHVTLSIEQVARMFGRSPDDARAVIRRARKLLYDERSKRTPPLRDEKILTSWNALMLGTLAEAGRILDEARFVAGAVDAAGFLWTEVRADGRLLHGWAAGTGKQAAFLDDHAFLASALVDLYEATGDRLHLERARELVQALESRFHDDQGGAYFYTAHDGEELIARTKSGTDGSLPSGNATAAHLCLRLHALIGEDWLRERAEEILRLFHDAATKNPFGYATYLEALETYAHGPTEVVVVGRGDETAALWRAVATRFVPRRVLVHAIPGDADPLAPARDRAARDGKPTAYVCRGFTCSAPVTEPAALGALLDEAPVS